MCGDIAIICPLCGSKEVTLLEEVNSTDINKLYFRIFKIKNALKSNFLHYYKCDSCCLRFFMPMEAGKEDLYENLQKHHWYYMDDKYEYAIALSYISQLERVLEVGAGKAAFASKVGNKRYIGLEFNDRAIESAKYAGIRLIKQSVENHAKEGEKYDAVVSFQVLEHVQDPFGFLKGCIECLKPGGLLIIGVPENDGYIGKAVNNILDLPPHHLTHWTGTALEKIAELFNLKMINIHHEPMAKYHAKLQRKNFIELTLRKIVGLNSVLVDTSLSARLVSKIASILSYFPVFFRKDVKGHSVVAVYKKA